MCKGQICCRDARVSYDLVAENIAKHHSKVIATWRREVEHQNLQMPCYNKIKAFPLHTIRDFYVLNSFLVQIHHKPPQEPKIRVTGKTLKDLDVIKRGGEQKDIFFSTNICFLYVNDLHFSFKNKFYN